MLARRDESSLRTRSPSDRAIQQMTTGSSLGCVFAGLWLGVGSFLQRSIWFGLFREQSQERNFFLVHFFWLQKKEQKEIISKGEKKY
jgi:hypothetical protein